MFGLDDTTEKEISNLKGTARSSRDRYYPSIFLEKNNSSQLPCPVNANSLYVPGQHSTD